MPRRKANPLFHLGVNAWSLGVESSAVIGLRMMKLATGGVAAGAEAERMVGEKVEAALALQALALSGRLGVSPHGAAAKTVAHYRRTVRANRRRLARGA